MSKSAQSAQGKRLRSLIQAMEKAYGDYDIQSGSNGDEYIFHCPLCTDERGAGDHRKHLRVAVPIGERDYPYVGCRIHSDDWNELRKALLKSGIPASMLAKPDSDKESISVRAPKNSGPGLGEKDPIEPDVVIRACKSLLRHDGAKKYRDYLAKRGIDQGAIKKFRLGINKSAYGIPRITIPVWNANGDIVNIRCYHPFAGEKDVKILPWPHSKLKKPDGKARETYGSPARIYGIERVVPGEPIVVCAGEFDRIVTVQNGINTVTGTGAEGTIPRREDCDILVTASEIYIVYDCDKAGRTGAKKLAQALLKIGAERIKVVDLDPDRDDGYDLTDFFAKDDKTADDLNALIDDAEFVEPPEPPFELSDRHMAEVVSAEYSDQLKYLTDSEAWLNWDGKRWRPGGRKDVTDPSNAVIEMARTLRDESLGEGLPKRARAYENFIKTNQVRSVVTQMSWIRDNRVSSGNLDAHRNLFNVQNGMIDLDTGRIYDPEPSKLMSKIARGIYKSGLKSQLWTDFLDRFVPSEEMQTYLQRLTGYSIMDGNPHRLFVVFKGPTSTGKSAFSEAVMNVLGDYAGSFNLSLFRDKQDETPRADIVQILTQRVGFASETSEKWHLHADSIKRITGADTIKARLLHSNHYFERIPSFTPIIRTNAAPTINGADVATFRRLRVVPFNVQIPQSEEDPTFLPRMMSEARDAILSWIIDGYMDYQTNGFGNKPRECSEAEIEFQDEVSILSHFIADHCILSPIERAPAADLYQAYQVWAMASGLSNKETMNKIDFGRKLSGLGYETKVDNGVRYRVGLAIKGADRVFS